MNHFQAQGGSGGMPARSPIVLPVQLANGTETINPNLDSNISGSKEEDAVDSGAGFSRLTDFWKRYDRLADTHDRKMSQNLNANLDVLLIFDKQAVRAPRRPSRQYYFDIF
ncbi:hypothetical protein FS837_008259 [Tulasnella sp. UAMH 9824]|nr:hypothetical protein FS837_008259 [Tulasnella sp. UAMH 9824]